MTTPKGASHNLPRAWPALRQGCDAPFSQARADAGSDRQRLISPSPFQGRCGASLPEVQMACEPWACLSQCGETASLMPALAAARFTMPLTVRSVRWPPTLAAGEHGVIGASFAP